MFTPEIRLELILELAGGMMGGADNGIGACAMGAAGTNGLCEKPRGLIEKGTGLEEGGTRLRGGPWGYDEFEGGYETGAGIPTLREGG